MEDKLEESSWALSILCSGYFCSICTKPMKDSFLHGRQLGEVRQVEEHPKPDESPHATI